MEAKIIQKARPYIFTIFVVLGFYFFRVVIDVISPLDGTPFLLLFSAVLISAWRGGLRQGVFAVLFASMLAVFTFKNKSLPPDEFTTWIKISLFICDGLLISAICSELMKARERAERSLKHLQESESKFRTIYESDMVGLIYSNVHTGEIKDSNDYFLTMLGYTKEDLRSGNLSWKDLTPREYLEESLENGEMLIREGRIEPFEKAYLRKDGSLVYVLVGATRLDRDHIVSFVVDNSNRKKAEIELVEARGKLEDRVHMRTLELSQSQKFLDSVIENIPNMIFVKDAKELRFVRFNKAGEDLLGYQRNDLLGKNDYDFFPKEEADYFTEADRQVLRNRGIVDIPEEKLSTRFGLRYLHTKKIPVFNEKGEPEYLLGISEDITAEKEAKAQRTALLHEQAARQEAEMSSNRFEFLSKVGGAIGESQETKQMLHTFSRMVVPSFADILRVDTISDLEVGSIPDQIEISHIDKKSELEWRKRINPKKLSSKDKDELQNYIKTGTARILGRNEIPGWLLAHGVGNEIESAIIVPLMRQGSVAGVVTFMAIAESKKIFSDLDLQLARDLTRRVGNVMENIFLFEKAQEASRTKSAFLANMSHEIRTPLGAMLGFAELVAEGENLTSSQRQGTATIIRNGRQLLRIVDEILDLSKVESDRIQIERIQFSLKKLVEDVFSLMLLKAHDKDLNFRTSFSADIPDQIVSDPTRVRQILLNIIGNAIKFTEKGEVNIVVTWDDKGGSGLVNIQFLVQDTGIGLSSDQQKYLFQPFSQADNSMTRRFGGTGLGLFLAKKLAHLLGGDLTIKRSQPGVGSEFLFTLPAVLATEVAHGQRHSVNVGVDQQFHGEGTVLVVDDSEDNRDLLTYFVSKAGFQVDTAENGIEAVEKALHRKYNIILMDIQMPGMDGLEAVKKLRAEKYKLPIVALTAHAMKGDRERFLQEGFDEYICKPIEREALYQCLSQYSNANLQ